MPRGKRNAPNDKPMKRKKTAVKAKARRKNGKPVAASEESEMKAAEAELVHKYPDHRFKPGTLRAAGEMPDFGHKRTIVILCADCDSERRIATSDVFHVRRCAECAKTARKKTRRKGDAS